jgi:hypothetical protein
VVPCSQERRGGKDEGTRVVSTAKGKEGEDVDSFGIEKLGKEREREREKNKKNNSKK